MSLSFVSKSIQTQDQDGEFTETAIEGTTDTSTREQHRPLFDQLRSNKEREEEEREEFQRTIMRGTLALDAEDAAYLHALQSERNRQAAIKQRETERELAAFHAAKMQKEEAQSPAVGGKREYSAPPVNETSSKAATDVRPIPVLVKKRRKLEPERSNQTYDDATKSSPNEVSKETENTTSLNGLLSGYGSDSSQSS
jgi:hypothetical protein